MLDLHAIDHIGIATPSLAEGLALYQDALGLVVVLRETLEDQGVDVALLACKS